MPFLRNKRFVRRNSSRGYSFEKRLETYFSNIKGWKAKRLAPSSTTMPDVVVTYSDKIFCFEAKATQLEERFIETSQFKDNLFNPDNESDLEKVQTPLINIFPLYTDKYICGAYYFSRVSKDKTDKEYKTNRKIKIYVITFRYETFKHIYKKYGNILSSISCNYDGKIRYHINDKDKIKENLLNQEIKENYPYCKFNSLEEFRHNFEQNPDNLEKYFKKPKLINNSEINYI